MTVSEHELPWNVTTNSENSAAVERKPWARQFERRARAIAEIVHQTILFSAEHRTVPGDVSGELQPALIPEQHL